MSDKNVGHCPCAAFLGIRLITINYRRFYLSDFYLSGLAANSEYMLFYFTPVSSQLLHCYASFKKSMSHACLSSRVPQHTRAHMHTQFGAAAHPAPHCSEKRPIHLQHTRIASPLVILFSSHQHQRVRSS